LKFKKEEEYFIKYKHSEGIFRRISYFPFIPKM